MNTVISNADLIANENKDVSEYKAQRHLVPYSKVDCEGNEKKYVCEVIDSGWLTTASKTLELEEKFKQMLGVSHAIAVNSCTAALHLALEATGVEANQKIFCPTMTFTASAEVIRYVGCHPVLLDVDPATYSLNREILLQAIKDNPDVKHMIGVHYGGRALDMRNSTGTGIADICDQHGITLIEDAAHALPARQGEGMVGNLGKIACFSFYANKTMTTGEGGMVVTNDEELARRIRLMRLHGIDRDVWDRFTKPGASWEYDVLAPGFKYNMPDLCAAVGLAQFERLFEMRESRELCARYYYEHLSGLKGLELPSKPENFGDHAWHLFPVCISSDVKISRNVFKERLEAAGIGTSVHYKPVHRLTYYKENYSLSTSDYPGAEKLWQSTFSLPIYNKLTHKDLVHVVTSIKSLLATCS
jgi:dTDP-4-amino-4,6-dideoxygalactose transaminase